MRPAARATAVAGIALLLVLCRLSIVPHSLAQAQTNEPPELLGAAKGVEPESATGAPAWPTNTQAAWPVEPETRTARPGFRHRTHVRLPSAVSHGLQADADSSVLVEVDSPFATTLPLPPPASPPPSSRFRRTVLQPGLSAEPEELSPAGTPPPGNRLAPGGTFAPGGELLPSPAGDEFRGQFNGEVEPYFDDLVQGQYAAPYVPRPGFIEQAFARLRQSRQRGGIGRERVALAPMEIEGAQPANSMTIRFESVYGLEFPDRSEYFWPRSGALPRGKGPPLVEPSVNYQDLRFRFEAGAAKFSATTELALRTLDPTANGNTAGFGDMNVGTKLVMVDGENTQISQVFRTYILSGSAGKGLGTGHVALEPGLLFRHKQNDFTCWHGEVKFWFPIAGDFEHAGEVLRYGVGVSHLLYDSDRLAILPVAELGGLMFFDGQKTSVPGGVALNVDGENVINFLPGLRFVLDNGGDLGLLEWGVGGGFTLGTSGWYDGMLRTELRMSF